MSTFQVSEDFRREWNTDAFEIEQKVLFKVCRELASRLVSEAKRYGQPSDVTTQGLVDLYYKQRGRCALTGIPLRKDRARHTGTAPSYEYPQEMEAEHPIKVERTRLVSSSIAGETVHSGMVAILDNIRFVCAAAHRFRHWVEGYGDIGQEVIERWCAATILGPPLNETAAIRKEKHADWKDRIAMRVSELVNGGSCRPLANELMAALTAEGLTVKKQDVYDAMRANGIDPRTAMSRIRVNEIKSHLLQNKTKAERLSRGEHTAAELYRELILGTNANFELRVHIKQFRVDLEFAMKDIGMSLPTKPAGIEFYSDDAFARRFPNKYGNRMAVYSKLVLFGKGGGSVEEIAKKVFGDTECSDKDHSDLNAILCSLVADRHADSLEGRYVARLKTREAAAYCGLTTETMKRYNKEGHGPPNDMGHSGHWTFSYSDLDGWKAIREATGESRPHLTKAAAKAREVALCAF